MECDSPIKKGFLLIQPQGVLSHIKKSWQKKYCELYRSSKYGIERLEVFDNEEDSATNLPQRIITLENCIKISPEPQKLEANGFVVMTKASTIYFSTIEEYEKSDWLSAFQNVAFKGSTGPIIEEDNDLYCSSGEGVYLVKLVASEASARCGLEPGPYTMILTPSAIQLRDSRSSVPRATWPYCFIRRYGYCDGKFTFEAGRMCGTGEGKFLIEYSNEQQLYRSVALKMKSMRKFLEGDVSSTASQLQVALGMEARSRSPIPPVQEHHPASLRIRAASQGNLLDSIKSHMSPTLETNPLLVANAPAHLKPKNLSASQNSLDTLTRKSPTLFHAKLVDINVSSSESTPPLQPKPTIPPRRPFMPEKVLFWSGSNRSLTKPSDANYDDIEVRQDAWKTLGLDDPAHTEDYEPVEALDTNVTPASTPTSAPPPPARPKFLPVKPTSEFGNYDTLQYFGSGKNNSKSVYKQVVMSPPTPESPVSPVSSPLTFHDYDEVSESTLRPLPLDSEAALDSQHGYGTIRRLPEHKLINNLEYAVVTKPRQV